MTLFISMEALGVLLVLVTAATCITGEYTPVRGRIVLATFPLGILPIFAGMAVGFLLVGR
jgi:hypothetical protein